MSLDEYTLIITEKPDAAARIASALDAEGKAKRVVDGGVPYYVVKRSENVVVVPALGHLYTVTSEKKGWGAYPVFDYKWVPLYLAVRGAKRTRDWLETIAKLAKNANVFVDACDFDVEGSIIGYSILKYACGGKEKSAKRMKYSTLMKEEIEKSYVEALPNLDFRLIEAGLARHEVDWIYGVNLSRALTVAAKNASGQYATISTGRVQGPTLKFLAAREKSIRSFVPTPYWTIKAEIRLGDSILEANYEKSTIETKEETEVIVNACKEKTGRIEAITAKKFQQMPPYPFDLGSLQSEAYRLFKYTPMRTLNLAQRLYVDALISYPRTSSQKLPPQIGYEAILKKLEKSREHGKLADKLLAKPELKPTAGKKEDSAHPAIYPTGNLPERALNNAEKNIWNLVVRRFMAAFGEPATRQSVRTSIAINGNQFFVERTQTLNEGWFSFYKPYIQLENVSMPPMKKGQQANVEKMVVEDKFTKPPARYNPSSLLRKMEKENIGTKATRAGTIQTLYDRKYVHNEKMSVTDLGFEVIEVLKNHCPTVASTELTQKLEQKMDEIQQGNETRENVLHEAIEILKPVMEALKEKEKTIGAQLSLALRKSKLAERLIGKCPTCNSGQLVILRSRKTGKRFVGCTGYFEGNCKTAFPLPQRGFVKPSGNCKECGWPVVKVWAKGKHPWNLCFNPGCPRKKQKNEL